MDKENTNALDHNESIKAPQLKPGEAPRAAHQRERMLHHFSYDHLAPDFQLTSKLFHELAVKLCATLEPGPERSVALRKLLESKDAAVRADITPGI